MAKKSDRISIDELLAEETEGELVTYDDALAMSRTVREILADPTMVAEIVRHSGKKPIYWEFLSRKNGMSAIVMAQVMKAMSGDTSAFTALVRSGWGDKIQFDLSSFYADNDMTIRVVDDNTNELLEDSVLNTSKDIQKTVEGEVEDVDESGPSEDS